MQGETVSLTLRGTSVGVDQLFTILIRDSANNARLLRSNEQLIVDDLNFNMSATVNGGLGVAAPLAEIFTGPTTTVADSTSTILASFGGQGDGVNGTGYSTNGNSVSFKHEGFACEPGNPAPLLLNLTNLQGVTVVVEVGGVGRIVVFTQSPGRQPWQSKLNP